MRLAVGRRSLLVGTALLAIFACTTDTLIGPHPITAITVAPDSLELLVGDTVQIQAIATDAAGKQFIGEPVTWSTTDPSIVTVSNIGVVVARGLGAAVVRAVSGSFTDSAVVTVTPPPQIGLTPDTLRFSAVARGPDPAPQHVAVSNTGGGTLTGVATDTVAYAGADTGWLAAAVAPAGDTITVTARTDTFPTGSDTARIPVTAPRASNSPRDIVVIFQRTAGTPTQMLKVAGDSQTATVGTAVAVAPTVAVKDQYNNPVPGVKVVFAVTGGAGAITGDTAFTDATGRAAVGSWTLDTAAGTNTLSATSVVGTVTFTATGTAAAPTQLLKTAGDAQTATVGTAVATAPAVTVKDRYGNLVGGAAVAFSVTAGNGAVTGAAATTNASGVATVGSWTLDTIARTDTLTAAVAGVTPVHFTAQGAAGAATQIAKSAGDAETAAVGTAVATPPTAVVKDRYGNGVPGVTVTFAATASNGALTGAVATTNGSGVAAPSAWTLGTVTKTDSVTASSGSLTGSPLLFTATAAAGAPATATKNGGDAQTAAAGSAVAVAPSVLVKDQYGNVVPGATVTFAATASNGTVTGGTATTNGSGIAAVGSWTLGTAAKTDTLAATVAALPVLRFTATVTAGSASAVAGAGTTTKSDSIGATLPPDSVLVTDQYGNPVAGVTVTWAMGGAGGTLTASSTSNAQGVAVATRTLGTTAGTVTDTARAAGIGSPVLFPVTTTHGNAAAIALAGGDGQTDTVAATLPTPYTVTVQDRAGNAVPGYTVAWAVTGGGSITATSVTNASGTASTTRVLGTTAGTQGATATGTGLTGSPVTFSATATHGAAAQIAAVPSTNGQSATVDSAVTTPPAVTVSDQFGNPVPGVGVTFALGAGGARNGSITGTTPTSNASGVAALGGWTLGSTAGADTVIATSAGLTGSPVTFVDFGNSGAAASIAIVGGDNQTDTVLATLGRLDSVKVTDASANPVAGFTVTWTATSGGGSITASSVTDANGVATAQWTLGPTAGTQTASASAGVLTPAAFTATANPGQAAAIALAGGGGQSAQVNTAVATAPSVVVRDAHGNAVSGVGVTFAATASNGSVTGASATTNASGIAAVGSWTLGTVAKPDTLSASSGTLSGSPVVITATAQAGPAFSMVASAGQGQTATEGTAVATPPAVLVTDQFGNPVSGAAVTFTASSSNGAVAGGATSSDVTGTATVGSWTLGATAKVDTLVASSAGLANVIFTATATAGSASSIALAGGDAQADTVLARLQPFSVVVRDNGGNPVAGTSVSWAVTSGSGTLAVASSVTDGSGIAVDTLTLGATAGTVQVDATATGLSGSPVTFTATASPGNAAAIAAHQGNGQGATVNQAVATPPSVIVTDAHGNGVSGVGITFAVTPGHGSVTGATPTTDASGVAAVGSWVLDSIAGANSLTATAGITLSGNPVTFSATGLADTVSVSRSTVAAGTATITACSASCANGTTASAITVTAVDEFGNAVSGASVTFVGSPTTGNNIAAASGVTSLSGRDSAVFNSTKAETKTISVTIGGKPITQTAGVTVVPTAVDLSKSLPSGPGTITASAGTSVASIVVTSNDTFYNARAGDAIAIYVSGTGNSVNPPGAANYSDTAAADANGQRAFTFFSTTAESKSVWSNINGVWDCCTTWTVNPAAASKLAVVTAPANWVSQTVTGTQPVVQVQDQYGNLVTSSSATVLATKTAGNGTGLGGTTSIAASGGQASFSNLYIMGNDTLGWGNHTLTFSSSGLTSASSGTFYVAVSFAHNITPIFNNNGCTSGCHGYSFTYANIVNHAPVINTSCTLYSVIVSPGSTGGSLLWGKINWTTAGSLGGNCGSTMPQGATTPLSTNIRNTIVSWINVSGAPNN